jgi:predicted transposase YdaD
MKKAKKQKQKTRKGYEYRRELKRFDLVLKEIFSRAIGKIISIATGEKIHENLEDITQEVKLLKSLRPDLIFRAGEKIFHIEIQAQQDKTLPKRMLLYPVGIEEKFGKEPVQIVLFVGKGKPPPSVFRSEFKTLKFKVVDFKRIDPDEFLKSDKPEEVVLGILAGKFREKPEVFNKVVRKISKIIKNEKELLKYMEDISFLGGLFDVEIKIEPMPIQIDIRKTLFYKWGEKEGEKRGKQEGLKEAILLDVQIKFGKSKVKEIKTILEKVDDVNHLKKIKRKIIEVKTWDDFVKVFRNHNKMA